MEPLFTKYRTGLSLFVFLALCITIYPTFEWEYSRLSSDKYPVDTFQPRKDMLPSREFIWGDKLMDYSGYLVIRKLDYSQFILEIIFASLISIVLSAFYLSLKTKLPNELYLNFINKIKIICLSILVFLLFFSIIFWIAIYSFQPSYKSVMDAEVIIQNKFKNYNPGFSTSKFERVVKIIGEDYHNANLIYRSPEIREYFNYIHPYLLIKDGDLPNLEEFKLPILDTSKNLSVKPTVSQRHKTSFWDYNNFGRILLNPKNREEPEPNPEKKEYIKTNYPAIIRKINLSGYKLDFGRLYDRIISLEAKNYFALFSNFPEYNQLLDNFSSSYTNYWNKVRNRYLRFFLYSLVIFPFFHIIFKRKFQSIQTILSKIGHKVLHLASNK